MKNILIVFVLFTSLSLACGGSTHTYERETIREVPASTPQPNQVQQQSTTTKTGGQVTPSGTYKPSNVNRSGSSGSSGGYRPSNSNNSRPAPTKAPSTGGYKPRH